MKATLAVLCLPFLLAAQGRPPHAEELLEAKMTAKLRALEERISGVMGYAIIDLQTGRSIARNADTLFPQASSIKIPIMMQVFEQAKEGRLNLSDTVALGRKDIVHGSGHLRLLLRTQPLSITVQDLVAAMIETSDNTATNRLIALVGMERVNAMLDRLGFRQTRLRRIMLDAEAAARDDENVSTPMEMAKIAELLYQGKAVDADSSHRMLEIMKLVSADFRAAVPPEVQVASKPGAVTGVRCETGVVYVKGRPFVLSVASSFLDEPENPVRETARVVYGHFAKLGRSNSFGNGGVR
jgi:beta-lactamase class A